MSNVCDPRKTGCDCYPFPHRRNSHPERECVYVWDFTYSAQGWNAGASIVRIGWGQVAANDHQEITTIAIEYVAPLTGFATYNDIDVILEDGQLVLKQDE